MAYGPFSPFQRPVAIHFSGGRGPFSFPFRVTVNLFWGFPLPLGTEGISTPDNYNKYQFILASYIGNNGPSVNHGILNIGTPLDMVKSDIFAEVTANGHSGGGSFSVPAMLEGGGVLTISGVGGNQPDIITAIFLLVDVIPVGFGGGGAYATWANYTATAEHIPVKAWPPTQRPQSSVTLSGPRPPLAYDLLGAEALSPPFSDSGDLIASSFPTIFPINVDFIGVLPSQRTHQEI